MVEISIKCCCLYILYNIPDGFAGFEGKIVSEGKRRIEAVYILSIKKMFALFVTFSI